jgi:hypothetical protein
MSLYTESIVAKRLLIGNTDVLRLRLIGDDADRNWLPIKADPDLVQMKLSPCSSCFHSWTIIADQSAQNIIGTSRVYCPMIMYKSTCVTRDKRQRMETASQTPFDTFKWHAKRKERKEIELVSMAMIESELLAF